MARIAALVSLAALSIYGQAVRVDPSAVTSTLGSVGPNGYPQLLAVPYATVSVCGFPANAVPCTNYVTTYSDATAAVACPTTAQLTIASDNTCVPQSDKRGSFGFWIPSGSYSYTITLPNNTVSGPYPLTVGGAGGSGGVNIPGFSGMTVATTGSPVLSAGTSANVPFSPGGTGSNNLTSQQWMSGAYYDARNFGASTTADCNDTAVRNAIANAVFGPGRVVFPAGKFFTCSNIQLPTGVQLTGVGRWSQFPEFATVQNTVIQANPAFWNPGASSYNNFLFLMGSTTGANDTFGVRIENMGLDGLGVANGVFVAQTNEHSGIEHVDIVNFPNYGLYLCGANNSVPANCLGYTGAGEQGDGAYSDMQFYSSDAYGQTASTVAIYCNNCLPRELTNITVAPVTVTPANKPTYAIVAWGVKTEWKGVHMEGTTNGMLLSPPTGAWCATHCNGSYGLSFENIDQSNGTGNVIEVGTANATTFAFTTITDNFQSACKIKINATGQCDTNQIAHAEMSPTGMYQDSDFGLFQVGATATNPGCSTTGDKGKLWVDNTDAANTHVKVCAAASGTPAWHLVF